MIPRAVGIFLQREAKRLPYSDRLLAFSKEYPELCKLKDDDENGWQRFEIDKRCFTYRIFAPYSEERKATARAKMQELNAKK